MAGEIFQNSKYGRRKSLANKAERVFAPLGEEAVIAVKEEIRSGGRTVVSSSVEGGINVPDCEVHLSHEADGLS